MALILKLLNGPMLGRTLKLPSGPLTLGVGDVDLQVAFDNGLSTVTLHVNDDNVSLQSYADCWVEGRSFTGDVLPVGKVIDLSGQGMMLLNERDAFEFYRIPDRLTKGPWKVMPHLQRRIVGAVLTGVILISSCTALWWWQYKKTVSDVIDSVGIYQWLAQQHSSTELRELGFEWLQDGSVRIYGECMRQQALNNVLQILRSKGVYWRLETRCQDQLLNDVRDLLAENGYQSVEVGMGKLPGEVRIRGDIRADEHWNRVIKQFSDVPDLNRWSVSGRQSGHKKWISAVSNTGLMGKVSMEWQERNLIISGLLTQADQQRLQTKLLPLLKDDGLTLIFQIIPHRKVDDNSIFPLPIVSIGGNKRDAYLTFTDGRRLQVGASLNQGFQIVNIDPQSGIDVYRDGQLLHIETPF